MFTLHLFAVTSRSNLAPCWSVKAMHYAEKHILWPIEPWLLAYLKKYPSRASPQGVVTWQWLALWHRPSTLNVNQAHTHTYTHRNVIDLTVCLFAHLVDECMYRGKFYENGIWDTRVKQMVHLAVVGCKWATGSAAFVSGQQYPSLLPKNTPVCCFFSISKSWFYGEREIVNRQRVWKRSFTRPLLVGDCWMSQWVDGRWCCDLRCHAPATFPQSDTPLCLTHGDPDVMSCSDCRSPASLHLRFLLSWAWCGLHLLPDLFEKSSSSESLLKKKKGL